MAYREKLAALNFATIGLVYGAYFAFVSVRPPLARPVDLLWLFGIVAPVHAMLIGFGGLAIRVLSGREGSAPADERDRAISARGRSIAYLVLLAGIILVGVVMPFSETPEKILNTALLSIVIAELVHQGVVLISYRRGWHA